MCSNIKKVIELLTVPVKAGIVEIIQYSCILCHPRDPKPSLKSLPFICPSKPGAAMYLKNKRKNEYWRKSIYEKRLICNYCLGHGSQGSLLESSMISCSTLSFNKFRQLLVIETISLKNKIVLEWNFKIWVKNFCWVLCDPREVDFNLGLCTCEMGFYCETH